ncbi:MAG: DMT family transporter [Clostridia bacterium]|nr:DMT family transporter [Clostridia bacterium]
MKSPLSARIFFLCSMGIFGTIGIFVKTIPISSGALALSRALIAILFLGAVLLASKVKLSLATLRPELPWLLASGAAIAINWILLFEAYKYTTVSVATLSYYFAPVLVTLLSPRLFRERMTAKGWICFGASTLGLVLMTGVGNISGGSSHFLGILLGLGAACFYAAVMLLNKKIQGVSGIPRTFLQFLSAIVILVPYVLFSGGFSSFSAMTAPSWIMLLVVGLFHTGFAYCLYFSSMKELPGQEIAILSYTDPLLAVLLSVFLLRESITLWQIVGGALILGFTCWNEWKGSK